MPALTDLQRSILALIAADRSISYDAMAATLGCDRTPVTRRGMPRSECNTGPLVGRGQPQATRIARAGPSRTRTHVPGCSSGCG